MKIAIFEKYFDWKARHKYLKNQVQAIRVKKFSVKNIIDSLYMEERAGGNNLFLL